LFVSAHPDPYGERRRHTCLLSNPNLYLNLNLRLDLKLYLDLSLNLDLFLFLKPFASSFGSLFELTFT